ncbi:MAG: hypothetical protein ACFB6R_15510 [Alphaproteobacteria bacterium]
MAELFQSGRIIDLILLLILLEIAGLTWLRRRLGHGPYLGDLLPIILSGAFLMLAVRTALTGAPWTWTAACLLAALVSHGVDLVRRW